MKKLTNLFGKKNTQTFIQNVNQKQNFNLFSDNNRPNDKQIPLFGNLNNIRNFQDNFKVQGENKNINIKINNNISNNIKKELNPKTFVKKPRNFLKESLNMNLFSDDNILETNNTTNNKNYINNNIIQDNFKKNQIKNDFSEENNIININNIENDNNDDIIEKNIKINIRQKNKLSKSIVTFNENKKEKKKKDEISLKKQKENERNKAEIMDNLKCYICMDKLKRPRMCKYCNRPACENCLRNWFNNKNQCGFCRKKIKFSDTIEIPIINDIADFFMKNINNKNEKNDNKNDDNNANNTFCDSYSELIQLKLLEDENTCLKHKNKFEFYCYQCNKKYCDKCLIIFNDSAKIHENHMIIPLAEIEKNEGKIKEAMEEMQKLKQSNLDIDHLIKICELKIRELEIEKNNFMNEIDFIKDEINIKLDDTYNIIKFDKDRLKSKEDEFINSIDTTPMALKNIISLKDYGQGREIYEHLSNLNKIIGEKNKINLPKKDLFIETFICEPISIIISNNENKKLNIKEQTYNFIPNYDMKISFDNIENNICLKIKMGKKFGNNSDIEKVLCFIIFKNKKYGCEFIKLKQKMNEQNEIELYTNIGINVFLSFQDENNMISYKLYFMIYKS